MRAIKRILHATDFSAPSHGATAYALLLARMLDVRIDVLHVIPTIGAHQVSELNGLDEATHVADVDRSIVEGFASLRKLAAASGIEVRSLVGRGSLPGPVILDEAGREGASLIVLGSRGAGGTASRTLGSVAADVVRRSTCPVFIVPPQVSAASVDEHIERVVTYVTYERRIEPVLVVAFDLARLFHARLEVLARFRAATGTGREWTHLEQNLRATLERASSRSGEPNRLEKTRFHPVDADDILEFVGKHEADLLVIEAAGLSSSDAPFEQAVETIVRRSPCPVVLINACGRSLNRDGVPRTQPAAWRPTSERLS